MTAAAPPSTPAAGNGRGLVWLLPLAAILVVAGARCWVVAVYGSATPYWDQWDADAVSVYQPFLSGHLSLSNLMGHHNEHRVLVTRLWALLLLVLNGYWDPMLQMVLNGVLAGCVAGLLVAALRPLLDAVSSLIVALVAATLYAMPLAVENVLAGFHSQWFFFILADVGGLLLLHAARAFALRWWIAATLLCASYLCMASGVFGVAAGAGLCLAQWMLGRRSGAREIVAILVLAAIAVALLLDIPTLPYHEALKADSVGSFVTALLKIGGWPGVSIHARTLQLLAAIAVIHTPALLVNILLVRERPPLADRRWLVLGLTLWALLNAVATAYGRSIQPTSSRYLDMFAVPLVLNGGCLLHLVRTQSWFTTRRKLAFGSLALWLIVVIGGAGRRYIDALPELAARYETGQRQTGNLRAYLASGDISVLENKPYLHVPFRDPRLLAEIVSWPAIRAILPPELAGEASAAATRRHGLARFTGGAVGAFKAFMLANGKLLIALGAALFVLAGLLLAMRHAKRPVRG